MVRRGALERCETGANPLETREKRKPVTPENDPRETGLSFLNGGGGGTRTPVQRMVNKSVYERTLHFYLGLLAPAGGILKPQSVRRSSTADGLRMSS